MGQITRVQTIHEKNLIYRDIKPDNFLVGRPGTKVANGARPFSILSASLTGTQSGTRRRLWHGEAVSRSKNEAAHPVPRTQEPERDSAIHEHQHSPWTGCDDCPSERNHLLIRFTEQSRRDDLESLGHVFMYFLRGSLPWQGLKAATNKQKYEKIGEKKQTTPIKELCEGHPGKSKATL
jgi:casein kinase 1